MWGDASFEQGYEVSFDSTDGGRLESQVGLEVLSNFLDETLEYSKVSMSHRRWAGWKVRKFANKQSSRFFVWTVFASDGTRTVTMGLLDTTRGLQHMH